jgi:hypothetical protein
LPSQSQPDPTWLPTAETSVYAGNSLEEAVAEARAYLGAQAQIRAARRVRQGLRGRVRFEVLAAPAPRPAIPQYDEPAAYEPAPLDTTGLDATSVVDLTLDQLLAVADEQESAAQAGPSAAAATPEDFTALVRAALQRVPLEAEAPAGAGPHPAPELLDAVACLLPREEAPVPAPRPSLALEVLDEDDEIEDPVRAGWSLLTLARAGVPSEILDRLPALDPEDDLGWLTALRDAISDLVPAPARLGESASAVVDGVGLAGATQILRAGLVGIPPGTLKMNGKKLRATAAELALAVRTCVVC